MKVFVAFAVLLQVSQHASGVEVFDDEESVQLSCLVSISVSMESTVVWSQDNLRFPIVHTRQQSGDDLKEQNKRYSNRTWMKPDALETGDLSLTLRRPTISDSETYTCTVRRFGEKLSQSDVDLKVTERHPVWAKVLLSLLVPLLVMVSAFGLVFYRRYKRYKRKGLKSEPEVRLVRASLQDSSVLLPCFSDNVLPVDVRVEWRRAGSSNTVVHVYQNGRHQSKLQKKNSRRRTEMKENLQGTYNLSLTLHHPCYADTGVYVCTVYDGKHKWEPEVLGLLVGLEGKNLFKRLVSEVVHSSMLSRSLDQ